MQALTEKQQQVYNFIEWHVSQNGYAASLDDIKEFMNCKSQNSAREMVNRLIAAGKVEENKNERRTIRVVKRFP